MNVLRPAWEIWTPTTAEDRQAVQLELHKILASAHFCNSKRYPALLEYIVEHALHGRVDNLKERTLGIEVFHRPADYDTNADTIVRYTAGEVRKRLALYYHENESSSPIQIVLPVGSYLPEFLRAPAKEGKDRHPALPREPAFTEPASFLKSEIDYHASVEPDSSREVTQTRAGRAGRTRWETAALAVSLLLVAGTIGAVLYGRASTAAGRSEVDQFWAPVVHQPGTALLCSGAVVFAPDKFSGVVTASKDNQYPFLSFQIASAIARVSGLLERNNVAYQMQPCTSIPLTELRDRPLILVGGYNNDWTMRLVEPLRLSFASGPVESIVDRQDPHHHWERDPSKPYSAADDYGLIARFHDPTTDSMVVVIAGLGRNGTEAAGLFATSPHYVRLLREQSGGNLANGNIEAVIKVNVVDGKTGAPSLESVYRW